MTAALVLSGLPAANACFVGFLPRETGARRAALGSIARHKGTLVFYESPLRVSATARELVEKLGDRSAALCRELTKLHEEVARGTLGGIAEQYAQTPPKGECVLVVAGAPEDAGMSEQDARSLAAQLAASGLRAKEAAAELAGRAGISKNEAYSLIRQIKRGEG